MALQDRIAAEENAQVVGRSLELLVTADTGRKSGETHRLSGRAPDQRLVHFSVPQGQPVPRPGDFVTVPVTRAAAYHLIADPEPGQYSLRRSRGGDAWEREQAASCGAPTGGASGGTAGSVSLGMPSLPVRGA